MELLWRRMNLTVFSIPLYRKCRKLPFHSPPTRIRRTMLYQIMSKPMLAYMPKAANRP